MARMLGNVAGFISGGFWTPGTPLPTIPPEGTPPRRLDYQITTNIEIQPRSGNAPAAGPSLSFAELRALAENWDVLRAIIQRRKEQMAKLKWSIVPEDTDQELDEQGKAIEERLRYPDGEHSYSQFQSAMLEETFVIDALAVQPIINPEDGLPLGFFGIDGATIQVKIDEAGRTPQPPNVAYQQVIKGIPWANFTKRDLIYRPWNYRFNSLFGYSKVEQIHILVNIGLRRQMQQLYHFTEGTIPESIMTGAEGWNPQQLAEFQNRWDARLTNNLKKRAKTTFVPHGSQLLPVHSDPFKNEFDEWCARIACFIFGESPQGLVKEMNRATAQTAKTKATQEGLEPVIGYVEDWWSYVLKEYYNRPDLRFRFDDDEQDDPKQKNDIAMEQIKVGALGLDEFRQANGLDPIGVGPVFFTPQGPISVEAWKALGGLTPAMLAVGSSPPQHVDATVEDSLEGGKALKGARFMRLPANHLLRLPMKDEGAQKKNSSQPS